MTLTVELGLLEGAGLIQLASIQPELERLFAIAARNPSRGNFENLAQQLADQVLRDGPLSSSAARALLATSAPPSSVEL